MLDGPLLHGRPVHAGTAGHRLRACRSSWAGQGAMRHPESQRHGEQRPKVDEFGPGPCHLPPMLLKRIAVCHCGKHRTTRHYL